ncbi:RIP metalloprotease RseP [Luteolibacter marinus]|uniref:RIP metalloprotease RseP n=1 Tax=Luteolibacter marinus TaxID=2776705 RepID=UPI001866A260|nr:RIP metalloprotease RseP [Luteolibacter marinus]
MAALSNVPQIALLIIVVIVIFNTIIFVHELGHFWAAKWRGLKIDRFQIWFGKPIWSKTINGVQYGLGWIPAGGFVALPQMAPMESIEGGNLDKEPLPPITPLDKIIVAFAGPLFSFLLALTAAVGVYIVGKPKDFAPTQVIAEVLPDSPGDKAGLKAGDKITHINGKAVNGWDGRLDSIFMQIVTSEGDDIDFTVERPGESAPLTLTSHFDIPETLWWQRKGLRQVGIAPESGWVLITSVMPGSPAAAAGIEEMDRVVSVDGNEYKTLDEVRDYIRSRGEQPIAFVLERKKELLNFTIQPKVPIKPEGQQAMIGVGFDESPVYEKTIIHPKPLEQISDTVEMMWVTITRVISPSSSLGVQHLSGPVGIARLQYRMLNMDHPWQRILGFMVLLNINLAILNMLPFPVLDGGHITLALAEAVAGRPVKAKALEFVQMGFAMLLFGLMIFVTTKDISDGIRPGGEKGAEYVFPES